MEENEKSSSIFGNLASVEIKHSLDFDLKTVVLLVLIYGAAEIAKFMIIKALSKD